MHYGRGELKSGPKDLGLKPQAIILRKLDLQNEKMSPNDH